MVPSKLLHIFHVSGMAFKDSLGFSLQLIFYLLAFACKGRIKKLDKACVDLTAFRASVRAAMKVVTPNLSKRTEHTGGDVRVSPDTLIDDDSTHTT